MEDSEVCQMSHEELFPSSYGHCNSKLVVEDDEDIFKHVFWRPEIRQFQDLNGKQAHDLLRDWMDPQPTNAERRRLGLN